MSTRPPTAITNPWSHLRQLTPARIALGRAGTSLPTDAQLDFQFAHAQARDAVHLSLDTEELAHQLQDKGFRTLQLRSAAADRYIYLQRPDLGRRLDERSAEQLTDHTTEHAEGYDLAIVIADGLSALAVQRHALPLLQRIEEQIEKDGWSLAPICLVQQGRVALGCNLTRHVDHRMLHREIEGQRVLDAVWQ